MKKPTPQNLANGAQMVVPMNFLTLRKTRLACTTAGSNACTTTSCDCHMPLSETMQWKKLMRKKTKPQDLANAAPVVVPMSVLTFRNARLACTTRKTSNAYLPPRNGMQMVVCSNARNPTNSTLRTVHCYVAPKNNTPTRMCTVHKEIMFAQCHDTMGGWT